VVAGGEAGGGGIVTFRPGSAVVVPTRPLAGAFGGIGSTASGLGGSGADAIGAFLRQASDVITNRHMLNTISCLRARIPLFLLFFGFSDRQFSRPWNISFEVNRATFRYQPEVLDCVDERLVVVTQPDTDFLNQLGHT
jgi:hypothetical protein